MYGRITGEGGGRVYDTSLTRTGHCVAVSQARASTATTAAEVGRELAEEILVDCVDRYHGVMCATDAAVKM